MHSLFSSKPCLFCIQACLSAVKPFLSICRPFLSFIRAGFCKPVLKCTKPFLFSQPKPALLRSRLSRNMQAFPYFNSSLLIHKVLALNMHFYPYYAEACCFHLTLSHLIHATSWHMGKLYFLFDQKWSKLGTNTPLDPSNTQKGRKNTFLSAYMLGPSTTSSLKHSVKWEKPFRKSSSYLFFLFCKNILYSMYITLE